MMIGIGIAIFSLISALLAFILLKRYERLEKAELTSYLLLFAWGSFLFGLSLPQFAAAVR